MQDDLLKLNDDDYDEDVHDPLARGVLENLPKVLMS